jgi:DNA adenine methylase
MGSKNRIAKQILPIILKDRKDEIFVDVFCGGCNLIDKVKGSRIANDSHTYLVEMWKALRLGWAPPTEISKEKYYDIKKNHNSYPKELVGFVGFLCSFGGKWWGGYAANTKGDNYAERGSRCLLKQIKNLMDVKFENKSYLDLEIPDNSIVYCDPPYFGTTNYSSKFDHKIFWDWATKLAKEGKKVFVSEYSAPEDWKCIKEIEHKTILDKNSNYKRIEKLFVYSG